MPHGPLAFRRRLGKSGVIQAGDGGFIIAVGGVVLGQDALGLAGRLSRGSAGLPQAHRQRPEFFQGAEENKAHPFFIVRAPHPGLFQGGFVHLACQFNQGLDGIDQGCITSSCTSISKRIIIDLPAKRAAWRNYPRSESQSMKISDLIARSPIPVPWEEGDNIPWNDPAFSERMLEEHLTQDHDAASRRLEVIEEHVHWIHDCV